MIIWKIGSDFTSYLEDMQHGCLILRESKKDYFIGVSLDNFKKVFIVIKFSTLHQL